MKDSSIKLMFYKKQCFLKIHTLPKNDEISVVCTISMHITIFIKFGMAYGAHGDTACEIKLPKHFSVAPLILEAQAQGSVVAHEPTDSYLFCR